MKCIVLLVFCSACLGCSAQVADAVPGRSAKRPASDPVGTDPEARQQPQEVPADAFANVSEAVEALRQAAVQDDSADVSLAETWLLGQGEQAVGPLSGMANDENAGLAARVVACRVLRKLGPAAKPAFQQAAQSPTRQIQINAVRGLGALQSADPISLQVLVDLLGGADDVVRCESAAALARIGPPAKEVCGDQLLAILNDPDEGEALRQAVKKALKKISPRRTLDD